MESRTDWDKYYQNPYRVSSVTRRISAHNILRLIRKHSKAADKGIAIVELGGANSCFYEYFKRKLGPILYCVFDNNRVGLREFQRKIFPTDPVVMECKDILGIKDECQKQYDLAFSAGLIEHFSQEQTAEAIAAHFHLLKAGGLCVLTFPTPTRLYIVARKIAEKAGKWIFWDERPLEINEVISAVRKHGDGLHTGICWSVVFTQGVVVARKKTAE